MKDKTPVMAVSEIIKMLELLSLFDKKDDIELTDELNNARKKRRRSSASIE